MYNLVMGDGTENGIYMYVPSIRNKCMCGDTYVGRVGQSHPPSSMNGVTGGKYQIEDFYEYSNF